MEYVVEKNDYKLLKFYIKESLCNLEHVESVVLQEIENNNLKDNINVLISKIHFVKVSSSFFGIKDISNLCFLIEKTFIESNKDEKFLSSELIESVKEGLVSIKKSFLFANDNFPSENDENIKISFGELGDLIECSDKIQKYFQNEMITYKTQIQENQESSQWASGDFKLEFIIEASEYIDKIESELISKIEKSSDDFNSINEIFRCIHSIKSGAGIVTSSSIDEDNITQLAKQIATITHTFENLLSIIRDNKLEIKDDIIKLVYEIVDYLKIYINCISDDTYIDMPIQDLIDNINKSIDNYSQLSQEKNSIKFSKNNNLENSTYSNNGFQTIRVSENKIDKMMNTIGELTIVKNSFIHFARTVTVSYDLPELTKELKSISNSIGRISDDLQDAIMSIRMIEVKTIFQKMGRVVRDVAQISNKNINLVVEGEETEIDKNIVEQISDPIVHIIRNAADHGIENAEDRRSNGKNDSGTIILRAYNKNKYVFIEVEDDGKGMDPESIKKKALEKGFLKEEEIEKLSKDQILNLIFLPGFSTAEKVSEVSGRGVGMDIVKSNINKLKGIVGITSEVGKGTKITIQLPITLSVARGLLVESCAQEFIIPIENIIETVKFKINNIHSFKNKHFTNLRGETIGVEWLSNILALDKANNNLDENEVSAVIINDNNEKLAVIVDKLKNEQEFVVKPLSDCLASIPGIAGSTLLGSGKVVLILNSLDIIKMSNE